MQNQEKVIYHQFSQLFYILYPDSDPIGLCSFFLTLRA
jgi:hypothetical protein